MPLSGTTKEIIHKTMQEYKKKKLHSGKSGKKVKSRAQAIAIALSQARKHTSNM